MDKITLSDVMSGFNLTKINDNFTKIQDAINTLLLGKQGDTLQGDLDVNSQFLYNLPAPTSDHHPARLKDVRNAIYGAAGHTANLIDFVPQNGVAANNVQGAVEYVMQSVSDIAVMPKQYGAVGDGVTDDTVAIKAMLATGLPCHIPYTPDGYLISDTLTISSDVTGRGFFKVSPGFNKVAVKFADPGYGSKRIIEGVEVRYGTVRVAGSIGIKIEYPNIILHRCRVVGMDVGIQVCSYGVQLLNCVSQLNNTNLSAYAPSSSQEINDLQVIGGNYDSGVQYAARIGDPRYSSTVSAGNPHGVNILIDGPNFDGSLVTIDRVFGLKMRSYHEGIGTGNAIELGGSGDNNLRNITIGAGSYFSRYDYAIYLKNIVMGLVVEPNYYAVTYCAVYSINTDLSDLTYRKGSGNGFNGPEVHTGVSFTTAGNLLFSGVTLEHDYLRKGSQFTPNKTATTHWYTNARTNDGWLHFTSIGGRFSSNPAINIAGTMSGRDFTCATPSDAQKFNGGDRITGAGGSTFVRYVDYVNGVITVDATGSGASTISHVTASFLGVDLNGFTSPEGVVAAPVGSTYRVLGENFTGNFYVKQTGTGNTGWVVK